MITRLCYKIDKRTKKFIDEKGNLIEGYAMVKAEIPSINEKSNFKILYKKFVSSYMNIEENYVQAITLDEYLNVTEYDDSGFELNLELADAI